MSAMNENSMSFSMEWVSVLAVPQSEPPRGRSEKGHLRRFRGGSVHQLSFYQGHLPEMSPTERRSESILLKERWSLIQSGVPREVIQFRGSRLLVRNKLHGRVISAGSDFSFSCHNSVSNPFSSALPTVIAPSHTTPQPCQSQTVTSPVALNESDSSARSQDTPSVQPHLYDQWLSNYIHLFFLT